MSASRTPRRRSRNTQMFALPQAPPDSLVVAKATYRLAKVFKHDFFAATCLYEAEAGNAAAFPRIVLKFARTQPFFGLPMLWAGRLLCDHEQAMYQAVAGIEGVPRWVGRVGPTGAAIEYVDAVPLDQVHPVPEGFFGRLRALFDRIHERGVAYCDANKRSNILVAPDGRPFLIDFQIAFRRRPDLPWPLRPMIDAAVRYVAGRDLYHLYKHKRRLVPEELTEEEHHLSRRRRGLHALHRRLTTPWRAIRRWFLRRQYRKGQLTSPTAGLEDHHQPEKETWRQ